MIRIIQILWLILLMQGSGAALAIVSDLSSKRLANSEVSALELSSYLSTTVQKTDYYEAAYQKTERPTHNTWLVADHQPERGADKRSNSNKKRWEDLTPRQRKKIEQRRQRYESMPPVKKERIKRARDQFRDLPPKRQQELRDRWKKSTPEKRKDKNKKPRHKDKNKRQ